MSGKPKIPLNTPAPGWNQPLAGLSAAGLPAGESITAPAAATPSPPKPARLGRAVLRRETAQRGGKIVTVVDDFAPQISSAFIEELARTLRKTCGCGGTIRERTIELQGDQPAKARAVLESAGFRVAGVR